MAHDTRPVPSVSVILPTCNRLRFLRAAVDSVFDQSLRDWELIIADDGSHGDTRAYLQSIAAEPRVQVRWLSHTGNPSAVRNAALECARGEYVAFLDSDDVWTADKLERQVRDLRAAPARWGYTVFDRIDASGASLGEPASRLKFPAGEVFEALLGFDVGIALPSVMIERELLTEAGGFDARQVLYEDFDLWLRLALLSPVSLVNAPLARIRFHDRHYGSGGLAAEEARDRMLQKLRGFPLTFRQNAALRAALALSAGRLAAARAACGHGASAWRTIAESSGVAWRYKAWWLGLAKTAAHSCLPDPVVAILRRRWRAVRHAAHG